VVIDIFYPFIKSWEREGHSPPAVLMGVAYALLKRKAPAPAFVAIAP
jgi:hypothetical protein